MNPVVVSIACLVKGGEYRHRADKLKDKGILSGLPVIMVGDNSASRIYVRNKIKACHDVGLHSESHDMPEDASEEIVLNQIEELNQSTKIHGILVQFPLPAHIDEKKVPVKRQPSLRQCQGVLAL